MMFQNLYGIISHSVGVTIVFCRAYVSGCVSKLVDPLNLMRSVCMFSCGIG